MGHPAPPIDQPGGCSSKIPITGYYVERSSCGAVRNAAIERSLMAPRQATSCAPTAPAKWANSPGYLWQPPLGYFEGRALDSAEPQS